jgi:hypothetical protein
MSEAVAALVKKEQQEIASKDATPTDKLNAETAALKSLIYTLIDKNDLEKAKYALKSYESINPYDTDILAINEMINNVWRLKS